MTLPRELLDELVELAARLAVEAGRMVHEGRERQGVAAAVTKSTATDVVTEFDRAAETLVVSGLRAARPDDSIVGEEGTDHDGSSGIQWLVDPIDGTTNFLYGLPAYAVSIGASTSEGVQVGAVFVPATDELFTATAGGGARLNGQPISCSATTDLALALVATGFSYQPSRRARQAQRLAALLPRLRDVRRFGAASIDLCYVAAGRFDVYYEEWLSPWDIAAGEVIAREAGCQFARMTGGLDSEGSVLVATPALFEPMRALLAEVEAH